MPSTSVTEDSSLTGVRVVPVAFSTVSVAAPQGTCGAQTTTFTPGLARSAKELIDAGLDGGTAISRTFVAKLAGVPSTSFASVSLAMFLVSAEAKTSAGAPWVIWVTRSEDPAKFSVILVPGFFASKSLASSVKVAFSDAAAKTVMLPDECWRSRRHRRASRRRSWPVAPGVPEAQPARPAVRAPAASSAATCLRRTLI